MDRAKQKRLARRHRHARVRQRVQGTSERPRLSVYRSLKHMHAQIIDDTRGHTLVAASTLDADVRGRGGSRWEDKDKAAQAAAVGEVIADRALASGIRTVIFDRGGFKYHGRVKALADAARKGGLEF